MRKIQVLIVEQMYLAKIVAKINIVLSRKGAAIIAPFLPYRKYYSKLYIALQ